jgi:KRAB domain-containing zinc finger protein
MSKFNKNNPTDLWEEDEKYDFAKMENKWLKDLPTTTNRNSGRVCDSNDDPIFESVEEINRAFKEDIEKRKQTSKFLCGVCDYATNIKKGLQIHKNVHDSNRKRFKCNQCNKKYSHRNTLDIHVKSHLEPQFECKECGKMFQSKGKRKCHFESVHMEKTVKCDECPKMFTTIGRKNSHIKNAHVFTSLKCNQCPKKFKTPTGLRQHISSIHEEITYNCKLCSSVFNLPSNLKRHINAVHEQKKRWFCKSCSFSSFGKTEFIRHMRIHTGEKPFKCKKCKKSFSTSSETRKHEKYYCK